jgi:hypothetical protein
MNNPNTNELRYLPEIARTQTIPAFTDKADYLAFVKEWKQVYKRLSLNIRYHKGNRFTLPERIKANEARQAKLLKELNATPDYTANLYIGGRGYSTWQITKENTNNPNTHLRTTYGSQALANWLLYIRRIAKQHAAVARQERLTLITQAKLQAATK